MAGGLVLMGILLALLPLPAAMMLHGITQLASNGWRALMLRSQVDWRIFGGYMTGAALTLLVFAFFQFVVNKPVALIAMGATPFVVLALPAKLMLNVERPWHPFVCGLVCQVLSLTAGVSGPILDAWFVRSMLTRHAVVATKAMTQASSHLLKIVYFGGVMAMAGAEVSVLLAASMVILAFVGTTLSRQVLKRMSDASFRKWTRWTVMTLGAIYLVTGVTMMVG